jgi:hypothetical protein
LFFFFSFFYFSNQQKKTPSPSRSPSQTPRFLSFVCFFRFDDVCRANYTPRGSSTGRSGSDRADLGLSISYRVLAQRGGKPAQQLPKFILYASASGLIRMEGLNPLGFCFVHTNVDFSR